MPTKTALIVDDSRVALHALRRLLEEQRLQVDTAESGEDAIKYLQQNMPPAVIFLDHMMPGMDGFEALAAIKNDAATAPIPVVMYTSKEGDAYSGHAKTLGAADVLSKPIKPLQLMKILQKLSLVDDGARDESVRSEAEIEETARAAAQTLAPASNTHTTLRRLFDEQRAQLRDDMLTVLGPIVRASTGRVYGKALPIALIGVAVFALWSWTHYRDSERRVQGLSEEVATLKTAQEKGATAISPDLVAGLERQARQAAHDKSVLVDTLTWVLSNNGDYDYDQIPLNDDRLFLVRELVTRLSQADFKGTIRIETHVAEFCLTRTDAGTWRMPSDDAPIARCDFVTYSPEQAVNLGKRQSIAFARFLSGGTLANSGIRVDIVSYGKDRPAAHYPQTNTLQTAGDWNKIARRNNRIEIAIVPAPQ